MGQPNDNGSLPIIIPDASPDQNQTEKPDLTRDQNVEMMREFLQRPRYDENERFPGEKSEIFID